MFILYTRRISLYRSIQEAGRNSFYRTLSAGTVMDG